MSLSLRFPRTALILCMALLAVAFLPVQSFAQKKDVTTWRVQSHWPGASNTYKDSLLRLRDTLIERTDGRLVLEPHEAGSLFAATETFNAVRRGIIPMATTSPAYLINEAPLASIASGLPFAFRNTWEAAYFHKHMGFEQMLRDEIGKHGVYYTTDKVYPTEMVAKKPINSLDDFKSLKIRSSGLLQAFLSEADAAASYIAGPELYMALQQGVVDGAHWGAVDGAMSIGLYEVAKYHIRPALNIAGTDAFIINEKALAKLPDDVREILIKTLDEQFWLRTNEYQYQEEIALIKMQNEQNVKLHILPQEVQDHMQQTALKVWEKEAKRSKESAEVVELLKDFLKELGYL